MSALLRLCDHPLALHSLSRSPHLVFGSIPSFKSYPSAESSTVPLTKHTSAATLFGHKIPAPILFAPIGINKLYHPLGELVPAKIAGELGIPVSIPVLQLYSLRGRSTKPPSAGHHCAPRWMLPCPASRRALNLDYSRADWAPVIHMMGLKTRQALASSVCL